MATRKRKRTVSFEKVPLDTETSEYLYYDSGDDDVSLSDIDSEDSDIEHSDNESIDDTNTTNSDSDGSTISLMDTNETNCYTSRDGSKWTKNFPTFYDDVSESVTITPTIHESCSDFSCASEAFKIYFSDKLISQILNYTNSKMQLYLSTHKDAVNNCYFREITFIELQAFIGLLILVGVFRVHRETLSNLYCQDPNLSRPIFKATLPRERFKTILRFLRFDNHETRSTRISMDRLAPVREVLECVNLAFQRSYIPNKFLTVDEHMCGFRGRCSFRQYMPMKPDRYGIKIYILADSTNFYPISIEVYCGKTGFSNKPDEIVLRLISTINPGHVVIGDNYFTSLNLCKKLLSNHGIRYFGTLRKNRREIPRVMLEIKKIPVYNSKFIFSNENTMVSYITHKNKNVILMSNFHHDSAIGQVPKDKPQVILDYNKYKCGVDILDMMLKGYRPFRTIRRWPCVVFFDLIAMATQASYVLYCIKFPDDKICKMKKRRDYLYLLGKQLVVPEVKRRIGSQSYKCLPREIKNYIDILLQENGKIIEPVNPSPAILVPTPAVVDATPTIVDPTHTIGDSTPTTVDPTHTIVDSAPTVVDPTQTIVDSTPTVVDSSHTIVLEHSTTQNSSEGAEAPQILSIQPTPCIPKKGRCNLCDRRKDSKVRSICKICCNHVCNSHSTNFILCFNCEDKVRFD